MQEPGASPVPLVVVHGGPGLDHSYLIPGLDVLAPISRLVFYDQRGVGRSESVRTPETISLDAYLEDIGALSSSLGLERVDLLAHSFGGLLAMLYAARYPERVRSLILVAPVEPGSRYRAEGNARAQVRRTAADQAAIDSIVASAGFEAREPDTMNRLFWTTFAATFGDRNLASRLVVDLDPQTARYGTEVAGLLMGSWAGTDFWDEVATIRAATLIVTGTEDPTPPVVAQELTRAIAGARLVALPGVGHFPFLESPGAFSDAVAQFLGEVRGEP